MRTDPHLQFIREKINTLKTAVMYADDTNCRSSSNDIVTALTTDDKGQLWLLANRPVLHTGGCLQDFPARLLFFKKGANFFIEVSGRASYVITGNPYSYSGTSNDSRSPKYQNKIVIKLALKNIEYIEPGTPTSKSKIEKFAAKWYSWFLRLISVNHDTRSALEKLAQTH